MMLGQIKRMLVEIVQQARIHIPTWTVHLVTTWPTNRGQWQPVVDEGGRMMTMSACFRIPYFIERNTKG
jgi:hypothetical protein